MQKSILGDDSLVFKFIIVGDTGVGKSSILLKYCEDKFLLEHNVTVGVDFRSKIVQIDPKTNVKVQIWDTAGQETFGTIVRSFYKDCAGVFLVYDVNSKSSFQNLETWLSEVRTNCDNEPIYILIGNQVDFNVPRQVEYEEGKKFMEDCNLDFFFETSARSGQNIQKAFTEAIKMVYSHQTQNKVEQSVPKRNLAKKSGSKLSTASQTNRSGCC